MKLHYFYLLNTKESTFTSLKNNTKIFEVFTLQIILLRTIWLYWTIKNSRKWIKLNSNNFLVVWVNNLKQVGSKRINENWYIINNKNNKI